jgi:hypothetical protein
MSGALVGQGVPLWLVALLLAVAAPLLVRLYADRLQRETARRTRRFMERMDATARDDDAHEGADEVKGAPRDESA